MKNLFKTTWLCLPILFITVNTSIASTSVLNTEVCIYGGTSAGVIAAYTAKKMGKQVLLIEPGLHLGGMSSGGLGFTDIGNKYVVTGLARDFYRRIGANYGRFEQWIFEPKVAEKIFDDYVNRAGFKVLKSTRIVSAQKQGSKIISITTEDSVHPGKISYRTIKATMFIDCSYEGDLMARAGVSYSAGREANSEYNETIDGVQVMEGHQMPDGIDPYKTPGDANSGLLWGINQGDVRPSGSGDKKIQAYNYRITLTNVPENRIPITRPDNYAPERYELLKRLKQLKPWKSFTDILFLSNMPNGKTDINNLGGFSTDMIGMNWDYPDADYAKRAQIIKAHEDYTKGLLYFVGHDASVPEQVREQMLQWGYPKDEFTDHQHFSPQLYIREARRMKGELIMTQHHCQGRETVTDGVGMAAYTMDSHNCDRQVINGMAKNEGNVEVGGFGPYPVSYRAITPKKAEATNLLVPVCLSATHIAYGSIRMEPVFMVLGQSAAVAACIAIDKGKTVQQLDAGLIRQQLRDNPLADGSIPEVLVDNDDTTHCQITGNWQKEKSGGYGPSYLLDTLNSGEGKSIKYLPEIKASGSYSVYAYFPKVKKASTKTMIKIFDGKQLNEKTINVASLEVAGQTSGEWIALGSFTLSKGQQPYVEISTKDANGATAADAILFVPQKKL
ncbi:FAD-dependent oxidoreductase [Mucilaginibacter rubeus]|uniref:FAD-dependent oxidoreductase n=1 Tax=Mucilaginibacter rubeus TaxID=2027860 RepID=A0A5C1I203_9SPHI|nr:FAD-dependent oxidoreductase [Mucilaginibacter rubeus]QEM11358.1 FAD-dependent oxidoreductase [Mucilaginibacter rubeus]